MSQRLKLIFCQLLCLCLPLAAPCTAANNPAPNRPFNSKPLPEPSVRVLLLHDQPSALLEVKGQYRIFDPRSQQQLSRGFQGKRRLLQATHDGIVWGEAFPGVHQIAIVPANDTTVISLDGTEYKGVLNVYDIGGSISIVNQIAVEELLRNTLPQRYDPSLPEELLAALAITARTANYAAAQNNKSPYWDVQASDVSYSGHSSRRPQQIEKSIATTKFMYLQDKERNAPSGAAWQNGTLNANTQKNSSSSAITLDEAKQMAGQGRNAAQILDSAFPTTVLQLIPIPA